VKRATRCGGNIRWLDRAQYRDQDRKGGSSRLRGTYAQIVADGDYVILRLNSGEQRLVHGRCMATLGAVSNPIT